MSKPVFALVSGWLILAPTVSANTDDVTPPNEPVKIEAPQDVGVLGFQSARYDLGDVTQGDIASHAFEFLNNGTGPLTIKNAWAETANVSVGSSREPVPAGEFGAIQVKVNTENMSGPQLIKIRVDSDAFNAPSVLYLSINVDETAESSAD